MTWGSIASGTEITLPSMTGKSGQSIDVPIMIDQVDNLAGVKLVMNYDPKILTFKNGTKTKLTNPLMHIINDKKPGFLILVMAGARGIKGKSFPIMILSFEIAKGLQGNHSTEIKIKEVQLMSDQLKEIKVKTIINPIMILPQSNQ